MSSPISSRLESQSASVSHLESPVRRSLIETIFDKEWHDETLTLSRQSSWQELEERGFFHLLIFKQLSKLSQDNDDELLSAVWRELSQNARVMALNACHSDDTPFILIVARYGSLTLFQTIFTPLTQEEKKSLITYNHILPVFTLYAKKQNLYSELARYNRHEILNWLFTQFSYRENFRFAQRELPLAERSAFHTACIIGKEGLIALLSYFKGPEIFNLAQETNIWGQNALSLLLTHHPNETEPLAKFAGPLTRQQFNTLAYDALRQEELAGNTRLIALIRGSFARLQIVMQLLLPDTILKLIQETHTLPLFCAQRELFDLLWNKSDDIQTALITQYGLVKELCQSADASLWDLVKVRFQEVICRGYTEDPFPYLSLSHPDFFRVARALIEMGFSISESLVAKTYLAPLIWPNIQDEMAYREILTCVQRVAQRADPEGVMRSLPPDYLSLLPQVLEHYPLSHWTESALTFLYWRLGDLLTQGDPAAAVACLEQIAEKEAKMLLKKSHPLPLLECTLFYKIFTSPEKEAAFSILALRFGDTFLSDLLCDVELWTGSDPKKEELQSWFSEKREVFKTSLEE